LDQAKQGEITSCGRLDLGGSINSQEVPKRDIDCVEQASLGPDPCFPGGRLADLDVKEIAIWGQPAEKFAPVEKSQLHAARVHSDLIVEARIRLDKAFEQRPHGPVRDAIGEPLEFVTAALVFQFLDVSAMS
jgi:hypothetical protein